MTKTPLLSQNIYFFANVNICDHIFLFTRPIIKAWSKVFLSLAQSVNFGVGFFRLGDFQVQLKNVTVLTALFFGTMYTPRTSLSSFGTSLKILLKSSERDLYVGYKTLYHEDLLFLNRPLLILCFFPFFRTIAVGSFRSYKYAFW